MRACSLFRFVLNYGIEVNLTPCCTLCIGKLKSKIPLLNRKLCCIIILALLSIVSVRYFYCCLRDDYSLIVRLFEMVVDHPRSGVVYNFGRVCLSVIR